MQTPREYREEHGIKLAAVASAVHVSRQTYAEYEKKPWKMPIGIAEGACAFMGCKMSDISFGNPSSLT